LDDKLDTIPQYESGMYIICDFRKFYEKNIQHHFDIRVYEHGYGLYDNYMVKYVRTMKLNEDKNIQIIVNAIRKILKKLGKIKLSIDGRPFNYIIDHPKYNNGIIDANIENNFLTGLLKISKAKRELYELNYFTKKFENGKFIFINDRSFVLKHFDSMYETDNIDDFILFVKRHNMLSLI